VARFIEEDDRSQATLFPERLDEYIAEDNPVRFIDAFVDGLNLVDLKFKGAIPRETGRPGYHPRTLLKLYIYGYINRVQSSRRLERETQRNVEVMWLVGRLQPDFKTIADFRKDNGKGIQQTCREFVKICRMMDMFRESLVAIDGSKFKAVNSKQKNDTRASMKRRIARTEKHIEDYLNRLDSVDSDHTDIDEQKEPELKEKLEALQAHLIELKQREEQVLAHPDKQLSETDPDSRLMKQSTVGSLVGYNVQTAVDTKNKLIVTHQVTNSPVDRGQLLPIARLAQEALNREDLCVLADRGYYKGSDIKSCVDEGMTTLVPKPLTSGSGANGFFPRSAFKYDADKNEYRCPADQILTYRHSSVEKELKMDTYYVSSLICRDCELKAQCTVGVNRRMRRWEHEDVLEKMEEKLQQYPEAMTVRASTVEHPFGTIKLWTGSRHFLMKKLHNVRTEMSLNVLAYNLRRMISILGVKELIKAARIAVIYDFCAMVRRFKALKSRARYIRLLIPQTAGLATGNLSGS
jgi:transposase